ncbi:MAG: twin-arginine translocation signal domain-containing protein [Balneolaceae bacterium]|nr:MAG: twin-arginine translocation signal domain-containing protein [Balneolaceae bacterium]
MKKENSPKPQKFSRRDFVKASSLTAGGLLLGSLPIQVSAYSAGSDTIKVALIGCGDRGTGAAVQSLNADRGVKLVAMADILEDRLTESYNTLTQRFGGSEQLDVSEDRKFVGFDGYKHAIDLADVVILTTPTFFRPLHFEYAVNHGKHVFMEKPVAVDAAGVRRVLESGEVAKDKGLNVVVGLQRRYQNSYRELYRRLQNGEIGDVIAGRVYWNQGPFYFRPRQPGWSELEHQIRNHFHFIWQAGDQVLDQMIHNIDVANWFIGEFPITAQGMGGREVRTGKEYGQIFDHNFVEFTYPGGAVVSAQCRQIPGCYNIVTERFSGTNGFLSTGGPEGPSIRDRQQNNRFRYEGMDDPSPYQVEHDELYEAIRGGHIIDNTEYGAKSTMASIMGFMATYSGQFLTWDDAINSNKRMYPHHDLNPEDVTWDTPAPVQPFEDGYYPVPVPGVTEVI